MLNLPENIRSMIGNRTFSMDSIGLSSSKVFCFDDMVLKIDSQREEANHEHIMMDWLSDKLPVPKILCFEQIDNVNYLLMSKINGNMLYSEELLKNPKELVRLLSKGLKMLWNVNITNCPYTNCIDNRLQLAEIRVTNNLCSIEDANPETYGKNGFESPAHLLKWLKQNKPSGTPVFSHGDYCLPNIFTEHGKITGFIDLGRSGVADQYQDIALCYRSLKHNFQGKYGGKKYEGFTPGMLFEELGIIPDWELIHYYILLDEL